VKLILAVHEVVQIPLIGPTMEFRIPAEAYPNFLKVFSGYRGTRHCPWLKGISTMVFGGVALRHFNCIFDAGPCFESQGLFVPD